MSRRLRIPKTLRQRFLRLGEGSDLGLFLGTGLPKFARLGESAKHLEVLSSELVQF